MSFPLVIADPLRRALTPGASVLLAISGGVDSAVSLAVLHELGCEVQTVTFKNFCYSEQDDPGEKACCSLDAIEDARALAHRFGARHWVHDVADAFRAQVIQPFVDEYRAARTPNPCLACNSTVRFPELVRLADQQGCELVATGHYAAHPPDSPAAPGSRAAVDPDKDQSYFLSHVPRAVWSRVVFPLGWSTRPRCATRARALGLPVADKPESQEICFVPGGDRSFLFPDGSMGRPGPVVDPRGRLLGEHRGLGHYTVGQRRGLGIAHPEPLYVLALEPAANRWSWAPATRPARTSALRSASRSTIRPCRRRAPACPTPRSGCRSATATGEPAWPTGAVVTIILTSNWSSRYGAAPGPGTHAVRRRPGGRPAADCCGAENQEPRTRRDRVMARRRAEDGAGDRGRRGGRAGAGGGPGAAAGAAGKAAPAGRGPSAGS